MTPENIKIAASIQDKMESLAEFIKDKSEWDIRG